MACFYLCLTMSDNLLAWYRAEVVVSLLAGHKVDFEVLIKYYMHERAFGDMTILPIPCMIQRLCDVVGVPDIMDIDGIFKVMRTVHTSMIKDLANPVLA